MRQIADRLGIHYVTVYRFLHKHNRFNRKVRTRENPDMAARNASIVSAANRGVRIKEIADVHGISPKRVYQIVRAAYQAQAQATP